MICVAGLAGSICLLLAPRLLFLVHALGGWRRSLSSCVTAVNAVAPAVLHESKHVLFARTIVDARSVFPLPRIYVRIETARERHTRQH